MPNILFISDNQNFRNDLCEQIYLYAPDFNLYDKEDTGIVYDAIILDDKPELLKEIRARQIKSPAIQLLSSRDGIESSAINILLYKPIALNDFLNQLQSSINVFENSTDGYLSFNQYELHPALKEILNFRNGELVKLTEKEVAIIRYLYKAQNKTVGKSELLQEVWGYNPDVTTHTIETHIYRLRQKVEQEDVSAQLIMTEDGGYRLQF